MLILARLFGLAVFQWSVIGERPGNLPISCSPLHNPLGSWLYPSLDRLTIDRPFSDQNSKYKQIKYYYLLTNDYICCKTGQYTESWPLSLLWRLLCRKLTYIVALEIVMQKVDLYRCSGDCYAESWPNNM